MAFDVMSVFVKIGADTSELEDGLSKAKDKATSFGDVVGGIGNVIGTGLKVAGAAIAGATTAVGAFGAAAVSSYANYEQLVGGVDKLYGTASQKLQDYADQAYLTAGMSANAYMETATSFSAALINSLEGDVDAAADMTDVAMKAISDNVNVFGSDFTSVQNAFQGFAKQNYTMLDNLKLGYGGTKQEMERLIEDANEYRESIGEAADLSIDSFADVVQAIQSIQEAQNIAGTTNAEAMKTIEGSANATKAAWQNVITAIGRGEGLSEALGGLTTAIFGEKEGEGLLNQIIPRIQTVMEGIGTFVGTAAPMITEKIPELVSSIVPSLLSAGMELLGALGKGFMDSIDTLLFTVGDVAEMVMNAFLEGSKGSGAILDVIDWILGVFNENYADLVNIGMEIIANILDGFTERIPDVAITITDFIHNIVSRFSEMLPTVTTSIIELVMALGQALIDNAPILLDAAVNLFMGIEQALLKAIPLIVKSLPSLINSVINAIVTALPVLIDGVIQLINGLVEALPDIISLIVDVLPDLINSVIEGLLTALPLLIEAHIQLIMALVQALPEIMSALYEALPTIVQTVCDTLIANLPLIIEALVQMVGMIVANLPTIINTLIQMIPELFSMVISTIMTVAPMIWDAIVTILTTVGTTLMEYGSQFVSDAGTVMSDLINKVVEWLSQLPAKMAYWAGFAIGEFIKFFIELPSNIANLFTRIIESVITFGSELKNKAISTGKDFFNGVVDNIKLLPSRLIALGQSLVQAVSNLPAKFIEVGKNIVQGLWNGISSGWSWLTENVKNLAGNLLKGVKDALSISSPSKKFYWIGEMVDQGFANGIADNMSLVDKAMGNLTAYTSMDSTMSTGGNNTSAGQNEMIRLLQEIASNRNVTVVLEGDADRLFRVVQRESVRNKQITGKESFA